MQTAGKPRNNKEHEEATKLFQRGEKILGGCWILIMALSALLLLAGVYFAATGRGEWIDTAAVLVPFLITGALVLFMASPYKKGVRELQKKEKFSPSTQRIIRDQHRKICGFSGDPLFHCGCPGSYGGAVSVAWTGGGRPPCLCGGSVFSVSCLSFRCFRHSGCSPCGQPQIKRSCPFSQFLHRNRIW